jgi:hypothetical protein
MRKVLALLALAFAVLLAGCGTPGAPLPPTLDLPQPPSDLKATRKGDRVTLTWTVPQQTTDKALAKHLGTTRVCRSQQRVMSECEAIGQVPPGQVLAGKQATYTDTLPRDLEQQNPTGSATYGIEVQNTRGRSGGLSNQVLIPVAPTQAAPSDLNIEVTANGPVLHWTAPAAASGDGIRYFYRVSRTATGNDKVTIVGDVTPQGPAVAYIDPAFEWEAHYTYRVTPVTEITQPSGATLVEGDDSQPVEVFAHDVFPPPAPTGVQAVYSGLAQQKFIDLTWAPNTDNDLAGYYVYRHEQGAAPVKISADMVKTPAFRDANIQPGHTYYYNVTAIDLRGNESQKSAETSENVPQ